MNDIEQFVRDYDEGQRQRIEFAWNGKHASEFHDANQEFRSKVVSFVCENSGQGSLELLRDLFIEESKWSVQAWCAPFTFANLGAWLLTRGGAEYLSDFLDGFTASFDTFGACHQMDLDPIVASALNRHVQQRLSEASDEPTKTKLESGKQLFDKLQTGNAAEAGAHKADRPPQRRPRSNRNLTWSSTNDDRLRLRDESLTVRCSISAFPA